MKKKTFTALALVILIGLGTLIGLRRSQAPTLSDEANIDPSNLTTSSTTANSSAPTTAEMRRSESWDTFEEYLSALKAHDLPRLSSVSYQLSDTCKNSERIEDCYKLMDSAYHFGVDFSITNTPYIASDNRQTILYSDYGEVVATSSVTYSRRILYFVRDGGRMKVLSFSPFDGAFVVRTATSSLAEITTRLKEMVYDTDGDQLPDETERCISQIAISNCSKSDIHKKDTDGDGWWDSIEVLFYK